MSNQFIYGLLAGCVIMLLAIFLATNSTWIAVYRLGQRQGSAVGEIRRDIRETQGKINDQLLRRKANNHADNNPKNQLRAREMR